MSDIDQTPEVAAVDAGPKPAAIEAKPVEKTEGDPVESDAAKAEKEESAKKERSRNRTADHIAANHRRIAEQAAEIERLKAQAAPKAISEDGPQPEQFTDWASYTEAMVEYRLEKRESDRRQQDARAAEERQVLTYQEKVADFAEKVQDFQEVVLAIPQEFLSPELQKAILAHERGPEIAYHIAQNDDDLFQLASIRPELMGAAVERLAKRLAAPQPKTPPIKPISNAPPPPATVSGRAPADTADDKLTDVQWYKREVEREKERRRS